MTRAPQPSPVALSPRAALVDWLWAHVVSRVRSDVYSRYFPPVSDRRGGYAVEQSPLTITVLEAHVAGRQPIGAYLMAPETDGAVRAAVVDLDDKKRALAWVELCQEALKVSQVLEGQGLTSLAVRSGSGHGVHLWLLWNDPQPAARVRGVLRAAVAASGCIERGVHVDLFPGQDKLSGGLGNLVALPFSRASVPIVNLSTGECWEDVGSWSGVLSSPGLARELRVENEEPRGAGGREWRRPQQVKSIEEHAAWHEPADDAQLSGDGAASWLVRLDSSDVKDREYPHVDLAHLRSALFSIDATDHETWKRVTLALKGAAVLSGEFTEDEAFQLWDEWSRTAPEAYDARDNHAQWRSGFKARTGGVTLGTVFHEARAAGWVFSGAPVSAVRASTIRVKEANMLNEDLKDKTESTLPLVQLSRGEATVIPPSSTEARVGRGNGGRQFKTKGQEYYAALLRWQEGSSGNKKIDCINDDHFQVFDGGKLFICKERWDESLQRRCLEYRSVRDFRDANRDLTPVLVVTSTKSSYIDRHVGDYWLEHPYRRRYEEMVFAPLGCEPYQYNLWQGWAYPESEEGSWDLFREHIRENICAGDEVAFAYVVNWLAFTVQHLDEPIGAALVLRGDKGVGKGFFVKHFGKLFGQNFMQVNSPKAVTGAFNAHLRDCVLLFADEAFCTGREEDEAVLKGLITEPTISIEGKGRDRVVSKNMLHIIMATNHDWSASASGARERRFCCINVGKGKQGQAAWFSKIESQLKSGGYSRMLHDLMRYDITKFDPQNVPQTDELMEQKLNNMAPHGKWWYEVLWDGAPWSSANGWQTTVVQAAMLDEYRKYCRTSGADRYQVLGGSLSLGKKIAIMSSGDETKTQLPVTKKRCRKGEGSPLDFERDVYESADSIYGVPRSMWHLPSLVTCREGFNKWLNINIRWPADSEASYEPAMNDHRGQKEHEEDETILF